MSHAAFESPDASRVRPAMGETLRLLRPDDLVILDVELVGLVVAATPSGPTIAAQEGALDRRLIFRLPPQHIAERAYFDASQTGCDKPEITNGSEPPDAGVCSVANRVTEPDRLRDSGGAAAAPARLRGAPGLASLRTRRPTRVPCRRAGCAADRRAGARRDRAGASVAAVAVARAGQRLAHDDVRQGPRGAHRAVACRPGQCARR